MSTATETLTAALTAALTAEHGSATGSWICLEWETDKTSALDLATLYAAKANKAANAWDDDDDDDDDERADECKRIDLATQKSAAEALRDAQAAADKEAGAVAESATRAEASAASAAQAMKAGDWEKATEWADDARDQESQWGDSPTWGRFAVMADAAWRMMEAATELATGDVVFAEWAATKANSDLRGLYPDLDAAVRSAWAAVEEAIKQADDDE